VALQPLVISADYVIDLVEDGVDLAVRFGPLENSL
jgi:DNA-binding transcriptional LysR family regulator